LGAPVKFGSPAYPAVKDVKTVFYKDASNISEIVKPVILSVPSEKEWVDNPVKGTDSVRKNNGERGGHGKLVFLSEIEYYHTQGI